MTIKPDLPIPAMLVPKPVIDADGVAALLGRSTGHFFSIRAALEKEHGFPKKLPGLNGWSTACVMRWIETNGETYQPAPPPAAAGRENRLERRYA